jgi:hypothetical protein
MNAEQKSDGPVVDEVTRVKLFLGIQAFFLLLSVFTGGFQFKLWSMLDSALAFKVAILLYLLGVLDMGINVLVSGVVGWRSP